MTRLIAALTVYCVFTNAAFLQAQEDVPLPGVAQQPDKQHQWLKQFVGEWKSKAEAIAGPGEPAMQCEGTMSAKMLGELWLVSEITGETGGMTVQAIQTIGYDTAKKKYVGTWVDSMINHMWQYEGSVDDSGMKLTLEAEGPNPMAAGKISKFRDVYEFKSKDHIVATSSMQNEDGEWITFMTGEMRRKN